MTESLRIRRTVASVAALGMLGLVLLPSEHVHRARTAEGRHTDVIHRHFKPHHSHHVTVAEAGVEDHGDGEHARWLSSLFITPKLPPKVVRVDYLLTRDLALPQPAQVSPGTPPSTYVSVHDPPWGSAHGLRAPPTLLV